MKLDMLDYGSQICADDPGEPTTGEPRISVTATEADFLAVLARNKRVLEIGTGCGISTRAFARSAWAVTTLDIDPWVHTHVWPTLPPKVRVTGMRSAIDTEFDLVFIDAEHTTDAVADDLAFARARCPVGMIVCHDAKIDEVRAALDDTFAYVDTHHGIAVGFVGWA